MPGRSFTQQTRQLWTDLQAGVELLATDEEQSALEHQLALAARQRDMEQQRAALDADHQLALAKISLEHERTCRTLQGQWDADRRAIERACDEGVERILSEVALSDQKAAHAQKEARWLAQTVYDAQ